MAPQDTRTIVEGQSAEWKCPNIEIIICMYQIQSIYDLLTVRIWGNAFGKDQV